MRALTCRDMGIDCDHVAAAPTSEEVKVDMVEHAEVAHAEMLAGMSESDKVALMRRMDERMQDIP